MFHVSLGCRGVHFLRPGKNEVYRPTRGSSSDAGEEQSHLTSMVTPDIHWFVRLDLVTGPPEKADDDEIQSLGKMLLDSLESTVKYNPLGSI